MHHHNDRPKTRIVVNEDGADLSRDVVTREPLPEPPTPVHICTMPGEELSDAERAQVERFIRWWSVQLGRRAA